MVTEKFGERVTAVRTVDITNPLEWVLVQKSAQQSVQLTASGVSLRVRLVNFLLFCNLSSCSRRRQLTQTVTRLKNVHFAQLAIVS